MLVVYIDDDIQMHERVTDSLKPAYNVMAFPELYEAYKWIKRNEIPDVIVTEMDIESSTGLQALKFLLTKAKLKNTRIVGYAHQGVDTYADLAVSEGAAALFFKNDLVESLSNLLGIKRKKTLHDVARARGKKVQAPPTRKRAVR
jgi:DNA-binding NtrC family response regulator